MKTAVIYDGRNCYSLNEAEEAGVDYYSMGRKSVEAREVKIGIMQAAASIVNKEN